MNRTMIKVIMMIILIKFNQFNRFNRVLLIKSMPQEKLKLMQNLYKNMVNQKSLIQFMKWLKSYLDRKSPNKIQCKI